MPPNYRSEPFAEWDNMKMLKDLNNSKDMVFDVKKQLNDVVDLTLWQRAQGMSGMSCGFRQPKAGFRR
jgi:hypothetical protein